jgi:molybdopterin-containing oxidoreductase family membrane subunit
VGLLRRGAVAARHAGHRISWTLYKGIGVWGNNIPVGWAFGIINFVWWIGIGHAGTLISAILLLFQQKWRTSINRFAEAMTLFAVICALLFPLLHTGRPGSRYWLLPYPSTQGIWPQFKSPLIWDVFAVSTYFTISLLFWFLGLVPTWRRCAIVAEQGKRRHLRHAGDGLARLGPHWAEYKWAYLLLAGLSTPLVLSVHTIVSLRLRDVVMPGWHTTIFPPYFVAGAVFSGFAMVMTWMIPRGASSAQARRDHEAPREHEQGHARDGMMVSYGYLMEHFIAWYSGEPVRVRAVLYTRMRGPMRGDLLDDDLLQRRRAADLLVQEAAHEHPGDVVRVAADQRRHVVRALTTSSSPRCTATSCRRSWANYAPTWVDISLFTGTIGLFSTLFLLFLKFVPAVAVTEVKELRHELAHDPTADPVGETH